MTQLRKVSFCAALVLISALACKLLQSPTSTPAPPISSTLKPAVTNTLAPLSFPTSIATDTATPTGERKGPFRRVTSLAGPPPDSTTDMQVQPLADGSVWVITSKDARRWDGQKWEEHVVFGVDTVPASVDESGRLWVVRQGPSEIAALQAGQWTVYEADSGWSPEYTPGTSGWAPAAWNVQSGAAGTVWLPMGRDVRVFDGERWNQYSLEDMGFPPPESDDMDVVHRIAMGDEGKQAWVGECYYSGPGPMGGQGVRWFDGETWRGAGAPVGSTCVSALAVDTAGNVWLGAYDVVWRYEPDSQEWTSYRLPEELQSGYNFAYPLQLIVDKAGDAWALMQMCGGASCGVAERLYRIHDGEWSMMIEAQDGFSSYGQLALDGSGQGWLFWNDRVYRLEGETMDPVAIMAARGAGVSPDGKVWAVAEDEGEASLWALEP
jgi:hypothetical protein